MLRSATRRICGTNIAAAAASALTLTGVALALALPAQAQDRVAPPRAKGPCDIYAGGGTPCAAAHSTTRALYASYNGPRYEVKRLSDNAAKDIGVVQPALSAGVATSAAADDPLPTRAADLVVHYPFNETSGTVVADASGN